VALQALHGSLAALVGGIVLCLAAGLGESARAAAPAAEAAKGKAGAGKLLVYVGGRGRGKGGAIWRCRLDLATGELTALEVAAELSNPSFLAIHPSRRFLYSVNEAGRFAGKTGGGVSAFSIGTGGELTPLNAQASGGAWPCHITVSKAGKHLLGANYGGGSVFVLPIGADGRLGERTGFVQHTGRSVDPKRQTAPHAHSINLDPADRFAFAADLGLDKVLIYRFDAARGTLTANDPPFAAAAPGAGPRHFAFHPGGKWAYVINELNSTMSAYAYDAEKGALTHVQTISTLPTGYEGRNSCAEVQAHSSGRFLYGSNRGHDSIAIFAIDARTGKLSSLGHESVRGKWPRNFRLDPTGRYLLAANKHTGNVVVFRIDTRTGGLKPTGHSIRVPAPSCVKILPAD